MLVAHAENDLRAAFAKPAAAAVTDVVPDLEERLVCWRYWWQDKWSGRWLGYD
jgi:hypothetical protein